MSDRIAAHIDAALETDLAGIEALRQAAQSEPLKGALAEAAERLLNMTGRLIVTGLGKSGHIGTKLAATFSSTGTPAYFVHGTEASHGDLGIIQSDDIVLMLTWSGGTAELTDLVRYCRRFAVPLIMITGNAEGRLAKSADICLALPQAREACPHNLAPTTSTLMQMAIGDALAVTLLQLRGFSETSFHRFHPGGKLGAGLMAVDEIAAENKELPLVTGAAPVIDVVHELSQKSLGIVGVTDADGALAGVITDGDIRRYLERSAETSMRNAIHETTADAIMSPDPITLTAGSSAARALNVMQTRRISAAFIVADGLPKGVVTSLQLLRAGVG